VWRRLRQCCVDRRFPVRWSPAMTWTSPGRHAVGSLTRRPTHPPPRSAPDRIHRQPTATGPAGTRKYVTTPCADMYAAVRPIPTHCTALRLVCSGRIHLTVRARYLSLSLSNSWPLWAVKASDYSPLLSVVSELDGFWQCTVAPVCDVIRPSSRSDVSKDSQDYFL